MSYTVIHTNGAKDAAFVPYVRLLRQRGVDHGRLSRVMDPSTQRRWLPVWESEGEAQSFVDDLKRSSGDADWKVLVVNEPPSVGPLGLLVIQLHSQGLGFSMGLHPLSDSLLQSAYPNAIGFTRVFMDDKRWEVYLERCGDIDDFARAVLPGLTGLSAEQAAELGYVVIEDENDETLVCAPPKVFVQV